jgi:hypothetical protein
MCLGVTALKVCTDCSQYRHTDTSHSEFTEITCNTSVPNFTENSVITETRELMEFMVRIL